MNWRERIVINPDLLAGKPVVKGTRISVEFVLDLLGRGWSAERILKEYDQLTREDILACLSYAGQMHKEERVYLVPDKDKSAMHADWPGHFSVVDDEKVRMRPLPGIPIVENI